MVNDAARFFADMSRIAGICPECDQIFRLSHARPYRLHRPPPSILDKLEDEQARIDRALDKLNDMEERLRDKSRVTGLRRARQRVRKMDQVFGQLKLDPHDAKAVSDPVDFIVFDGMSHGKLRKLVFVANSPTTKVGGAVLRSIEKAVENGNFEFRTLRILPDGLCSLK